jgi:spore coat polysaccharide biosynthesis protein SpsF
MMMPFNSQSPRIVAIIQARMGSTRLPGKVLRDILGQPMLMRGLIRARHASCLQGVVVATTTDAGDDAIQAFCEARGYPVYRGSQGDVLDRYYQAARLFQADVIVRLTADCPLVDPGVIDHTVAEFFHSGVDFAANRLPPPLGRTYPIGLDTEVCSFQGLERVWKEAQEPYEREHVMPYFYDVPGRFRVLRVDYPVDYGALRWTVDTEEDLEVVRKIFAHFGGRNDFSWLEVLSLYDSEPELFKLNAGVTHKTFRSVG